MENEVSVYQGMPAAIIEKAIAGNADLDKLEKLLELQERWERNEAKKAYVKAMADFKANAPEIEKDKPVSYGPGKASYNYASLANVTKKVSSELSKHGLSASWSTTQKDKDVCVSCTITHIQGHSETTSLSAAPDTSGSKNSIQAIGSTISYLERYTLLAMLGIATHDQDNDGNTATENYINENQQVIMKDRIKKAYGENEEFITKFFEHIGCTGVNDIPVSEYQRHKAELEAIAKKRAK
jgi:hypothetical protein